MFLRRGRCRAGPVPFFVYVLSSRSRALYVGVTNDIERRLAQHCDREVAFTSRYQIGRLVHLEEFQFVDDAIRRESELKAWRRSKKIALVKAKNPDWRDLADEESELG
jgi:putative endonuclease